MEEIPQPILSTRRVSSFVKNEKKKGYCEENRNANEVMLADFGRIEVVLPVDHTVW
jgi:hypothetical protein